MPDNISIVQNKCVGCRSCEQACPRRCISMKETGEGFLYPDVSEKDCTHCGLCLKCCPTENTDKHRNKPQNVWAFRNRNDVDIMHSASGGAADVATQIMIQQGGVVYGAAYDEEFRVKHIEVTDHTMRRRLQSSKYVQSDVGDCYEKVKEQLENGRKVLFTGTPCQVAGLYSFLRGDKTDLYTLDLICHGVPSPKLFHKYLEWQERKMKGKVIEFNFRSKEKRGWGTQYLLKTGVETKARPGVNTKIKILSLDRYGKHFIEGDCYRESCYQCPYANTDRVADITVGDFWGIEKCHPGFYSSKGVSSVFVNTEKGRSFFVLMEEFAEILPVTMEEGLLKQGNLVKPSRRPACRDTFYRKIDENDFIEKLKVGMQVKERIKAFVPAKVVRFVKRKLR